MLPGRPGRVAACIGGQHLADHAPLAWGGASDVAQRVDAAEGDVELPLPVAKLLNRSHEPLDILTSPDGLELAVADVGRGEHGQAGDALEEGRAGLVLHAAAGV